MKKGSQYDLVSAVVVEAALLLRRLLLYLLMLLMHHLYLLLYLLVGLLHHDCMYARCNSERCAKDDRNEKVNALPSINPSHKS